MNTESLIRVCLAAVLAIIPAIVWGFVFYKKQVGKKSMIFSTFAMGALFVTPLLIYKYLWQYFPWLDAFQYTDSFKEDFIGFSTFSMIPLNVIMTFMIVGVIEETTKLWAVKATDKKQICSIDDAIEMSIMAALGFSFAENILYFSNIIEARGIENILYPFIFRSLFSTFAHIMFSGIMGYYYGMALFSGDVLKDKHYEKKWLFTRLFAKIMHLKKATLFHDEKLAQGLLIAIVLHAIFNIMLEMNWVFLLVPFLTGGYVYLSHLLSKKEAHKNYQLLHEVRNDIRLTPENISP